MKVVINIQKHVAIQIAHIIDKTQKGDILNCISPFL